LKRALASDIHSNHEPLPAVLADIYEQGIDHVYCLGDVVGYGPNPRECICEMKRVAVCILRNRDEAVFAGSATDEFRPSALQAVEWTCEQLHDEDHEFLHELPRHCREERLLLVHGSLKDPTSEYVLSMDVHSPIKMMDWFDRVDQCPFQGHTHVPRVFCRSEFLRPNTIEHRYTLTNEKVMINVGSVGRPREGDPRACYVVLEEQHVVFHSVEYDVESTVAKIHRIEHLDDSMGDRLREGC